MPETSLFLTNKTFEMTIYVGQTSSLRDVLTWNTFVHGCEEEIAPFNPEIVNIIILNDI